jgi:PAS domain S-box-containing protein
MNRITALRDNEQILAAMARCSSDGIVITDPEGRVEWINQDFTNLYGYTLEEMLGEKPGRILQGEGTNPAAVEELRNAIRSGRHGSVEILNCHKDGHPCRVLIDLTPIRDSEGKITNFAAIEREVTSRKIEIVEHEKAVAELYDAVFKLADQVNATRCSSSNGRSE